MRSPRSRVSREQTLVELAAALTSSLNLTEVLRRSYEVLSTLLAADCAAICVSKPSPATGYEWAVEADVLKEFFQRYPNLADQDFVRRAVVKQPNKVLRDSEMVSREELKQNPIYQYFQGTGPLEHVMAVLLDMGQDWHGGFTLYRAGQRAFSPQEQDLLQQLTPALAGTVRNCKRLSELSERGHIMESLFQHGGVQGVVLIPPATEVLRTYNVTELVCKWFEPWECGRHGLPVAWLERLTQLASLGALAGFSRDTLEHKRGDQSLKVTFVALPEQGWRRPWAVLLEEVWRVMPVPQQWRKTITPREAEVVALVLQGVDNKYIAEALHLSVDTVKTHLKKAFVKLAVPSRAKLILLAQELNAQEASLRS